MASTSLQNHLDLNRIIEQKQRFLPDEARDEGNFLQGYPQISPESTRKIYKYINENKEMLIELAKTHGTDVYVRRDISKLDRTLQITQEGRVFIHFNRKKKKDHVLGEGMYKKLTLAIDAESRRRFISFTYKEAYSTEVELLKKFQSENGFSKFVSEVSYEKESVEGQIHKNRVLLEYYNRGNLYELLLSGKPLSPKDKQSIFIDVVTALAQLHTLGYIHNDIKTDNIFIHKEEETHAVIGDFGFTCKQDKILEEELVGTPFYFSPEYARKFLGGKASVADVTTFKKDVWALGILLLELLGKATPWNNLYPIETVQYIAGLEEGWMKEPPNTHSPEHLIWEMLHIDPTQRISAQKAKEKLETLEFLET